MQAMKRLVRVLNIVVLCTFIVACPEPRNDAGLLADEFMIELSETALDAATGRSTINDDTIVEKVYAKVFNSAREHLVAIDATSDISGVTKLTKSDGKWKATVKLATPVSGTITFMVWAVNSAEEHLYSGYGSITVPDSTSITVTTQEGYALRDLGPAGGYIFYDKGSYSNSWRYLEAARAGWSGTSDDPGYTFGYHRPSGTNLEVGTGTAIGTGKANTTALVAAMGDTAYDAASGTTKTLYAAKVCSDHDGGAYDDWFLPSKEEMDLMYDNLKASAVGGFSTWYYWNSSEYGDALAWCQHFDSNGNWDNSIRANAYQVRPVRSF
jgi:hypothetical protein